ncbi:Polynucleotide 5'-hydroxyl-kinase nol9 [Smittium culicis]|uniref:Polynucleotide 5'-hydroxyl-kinase GRC3 n=1 Tax=Smittium culicis TaxID=133412 RepID=A0A1R1YAU1_9FUNG|nr:Polynucleotide 5'-hydroxyl-kinase nol9 [Smittium culicis]
MPRANKQKLKRKKALQAQTLTNDSNSTASILTIEKSEIEGFVPSKDLQVVINIDTQVPLKKKLKETPQAVIDIPINLDLDNEASKITPSAINERFSEYNSLLPHPKHTNIKKARKNQLPKAEKKIIKELINSANTSDFISSWIPKHQDNYSKRKLNISSNKQNELESVILGFNQNQKLVFQGSIIIRLLKGTAEVAGTNLIINQWVRVYSTAVQSLFYIKSLDVNPEKTLSINEIEFDGFKPQVQDIYSKIIKNYETVVEIVQDNSAAAQIASISQVYKYLFYPKRYKKPNSKLYFNDPRFKLELSYRQDVSIQGFYPMWSIKFNYESFIKTSILEFPNSWENIANDIIDFQLNSKKIPNSKNFNSSKQESENDLDSINAKVIITGQKSTGKSTFSKFLRSKLSNKFSKIYYIETDLGQPDLSPAGVVSLHVIYTQTSSDCSKIYFKPFLPQFVGLKTIGPSFTSSSNYYFNPHQNNSMLNTDNHYSDSANFNIDYRATVLKSVYLGTTTPKYNPERYIKAVQSLVDYYNSEISSSQIHQSHIDADLNINNNHCPLIVNTHGWVKSLGLDLLADLCDLVSPTHFYQMSADPKSSNFYLDNIDCLPQSTICQFVPVVFSEINTITAPPTKATGNLSNQSNQALDKDLEKNGVSKVSSIITPTPKSFDESQINDNGSMQIMIDETSSEDDFDNAEHTSNNDLSISQEICPTGISNAHKNKSFSIDTNPTIDMSTSNEHDNTYLEKNNDSNKSYSKNTEINNANFNRRLKDQHDKEAKSAITSLLNIRNQRSFTFDTKSLSMIAHIFGLSTCNISEADPSIKYDKWLFNLPLTNRIPILVPFKSVTVFLCENEIEDFLVPRLLNGSLVSVLVRILNEEFFSSDDDSHDAGSLHNNHHSISGTNSKYQKKGNIQVVNDFPPLSYDFVSHAIIRAVDVDSLCFHLLLPPSSNFPPSVANNRDYNNIQIALVIGPSPSDSGVALPISARLYGTAARKSTIMDLGGIPSDTDSESDFDYAQSTENGNFKHGNNFGSQTSNSYNINDENYVHLDNDSLLPANGKKLKTDAFINETKFGRIDVPYLAVGTQYGVGSTYSKPKKNLRRR